MNLLLACDDWSDRSEARWLARGLAAAGDRVTVLVLEASGSRPTRGLSRRIAEPGYEVGFLGAASTPLDVNRAVETLLRESRFDLAHLLSVQGPLARVAARLDCAAIPLVHTAASGTVPVSDAPGRKWGQSPFFDVETRRLFGRFARVLVRDEATTRGLLSAGVDPLCVGRDAGGPSPWGAAPPGFEDGLQPILHTYGEVLEARALPRLPARDRLVAVVLHQRGLAQTLAAVRALDTGTRRPDAVVVVDNAPFDGASAFLRAGLPGVQVLEVDEAQGFTHGANVGLERAMALGADQVFFLSGEVLVQPDTVQRLTASVKRFESLGVVGPVLRKQAAPEQVLTAGVRWSPRSGRVTQLGRGQSTRAAPDWELKDVDGLSSLALLVTRHTLDAVGLFDAAGTPGFVALDFCLRARASGLGVACLPSASALYAPAARERNPLERLLDARAQWTLAQTHSPRPAFPAFARGAAIVASQAAQAVEKRAPRPARVALSLARAAFARFATAN